MFNHKKFLAALLCTPLFTACVVNGDDTDDVGNTETDPSTTNSTTMSTTAGTEDDTSAGTTVSTTVSTDDSGSESVDSGSSDEGTTGEPGGMFCTPACEEAIDCCGGEPTCEGAIGAYPYEYTCDAGVCGYGDGCASQKECTASGLPAEYECILLDGFGLCELPCTTAMDCEDAFLAGYECLDDGAGGTTCQNPCTEDADCVGGGVCDTTTGACDYPCAADEDCFGGGSCDTTTGICSCAEGTDCDKGFACAG